jgi:hypothetical protein
MFDLKLIRKGQHKDRPSGGPVGFGSFVYEAAIEGASAWKSRVNQINISLLFI